MKKTIIILSTIALIVSCGHATAKHENEKLPDVESIDISELLGKEKEFFGMIGDDVQKMGIVFLSTTRISETEYEVIGKSKVKNNICDFKGVIETQYVVESDLDEEYREVGYADGKVIGKYRFYEDKNQTHTGIFEGNFEIYWVYQDDNTIGLADLWYTVSDYNAIFNGEWRNYQTGSIKKACWSNYRGCYPRSFRSDGPDVIPPTEYRSKGWFEVDMFSSDEEKRAIAEKEWCENWLDWWK